jgi:hypothetical protein
MASDALKKQRERFKKRKHGLIKKGEQLRRSVTGVEVAIFIYDGIAQQYCIYRSNGQETWPPSVAEIVRASFLSWLLFTHPP